MVILHNMLVVLGLRCYWVVPTFCLWGGVGESIVYKQATGIELYGWESWRRREERGGVGIMYSTTWRGAPHKRP